MCNHEIKSRWKIVLRFYLYERIADILADSNNRTTIKMATKLVLILPAEIAITIMDKLRFPQFVHYITIDNLIVTKQPSDNVY